MAGAKGLQVMQWVVGTIAGLVVIVSATWGVMVWAGDNRYVLRDDMPSVVKSLRLQFINDAIDDLEIKIKYGEASKADEVKLSAYIRKREEIISNQSK